MPRSTARLVSRYAGSHDAKVQLHIEMLLLRHILRLIPCKVYSKAVKPYLSAKDAKELRKAAFANFDISVSLKHALLECLRRNLHTPNKKKERLAVFKRWEIRDHGSVFREFRRLRVMTAAMKQAKACQTAHLFTRPSDVRRQCGEHIMKIEGSITRCAMSKLSFVAKSNNLPMSAMVADLVEYTIEAYYASTPFLSPTHLNLTLHANYNKKAQHVIKKYTAEKRKRLKDDTGQGCESVHVTLNMVGTDGDNDGGENHALYSRMSDLSATEPGARASEVSMSWDALMERQGRHPVKRQILNLISFRGDIKFLEFVRQRHPRRIRAAYDAQDIFERLGRDEYLECVRTFTGATPEAFASFLKYVHESVNG